MKKWCRGTAVLNFELRIADFGFDRDLYDPFDLLTSLFVILDPNKFPLTKIGLLSDTHHFLDPQVFEYFENCDEVWHAGDLGTIAIADEIRKKKPLRAVYGNIDGSDVRNEFPEQLVFYCEDVKVMVRHIGGYPPKYNPATKKELLMHRPQLFISGHSHILKIMFDQQMDCLHMNPGAAGKQGWHKLRTLVRFTIDGKEMKDCEVIELR
jgi:putative phosphoesterase